MIRKLSVAVLKTRAVKHLTEGQLHHGGSLSRQNVKSCLPVLLAKRMLYKGGYGKGRTGETVNEST